MVIMRGAACQAALHVGMPSLPTRRGLHGRRWAHGHALSPPLGRVDVVTSARDLSHPVAFHVEGALPQLTVLRSFD